MGNRLALAAGLLAAAGCGGKGAGPSTAIENDGQSPPADGVLRLDANAALRDCPEGTLQALAPGWEELDDWVTPQLDACLRGNLVGQSVIVYASARPEPDSQSEVSWPARRVIVDGKGQVLLEGPGDGGSWLSDPAQLEALVDLDGDGVHEILDSSVRDPGGEQMTLDVLRVVNDELVHAGQFVTRLSDSDVYRCEATWSVGEPDAQGRRALVFEVAEDGSMEQELSIDVGGDEPLGCPGMGTHHVTLEEGMLVDDFAGEEGEEGCIEDCMEEEEEEEP